MGPLAAPQTTLPSQAPLSCSLSRSVGLAGCCVPSPTLSWALWVQQGTKQGAFTSQRSRDASRGSRQSPPSEPPWENFSAPHVSVEAVHGRNLRPRRRRVLVLVTQQGDGRDRTESSPPSLSRVPHVPGGSPGPEDSGSSCVPRVGRQSGQGPGALPRCPASPASGLGLSASLGTG